MVREPAPAPEPAGVARVESPADLVRPGGTVVDGFPLEHYRAGAGRPGDLHPR
ncbi:MAG: hypothetical protein QOI78_4800 [Actinomycetota bacterium]|nr:hypothetical protein [Actinomycetota bacterium]